MPDRRARKEFIGPKEWRCELCGHRKGLIENRGYPHRIECFSITACDARRKAVLDA